MWSTGINTLTDSRNDRAGLPVAIVQAAPVPGDLTASLAKALSLAEGASRAQARLICFGETFLPGYPAWLDYCPEAALWNNPAVKETYAELRANSVVVPGPETESLAQAAGRLQVGIVIGVHERVNDAPGHGTLYNTLLFFGPEGQLVNRHRKIMPTFSERMVWGQGDASGLQSVKIHGVNVGGLICWEHWMPLARQQMHNQGEQIHIAAWPTVHEMHQVASRHYAFEARCFVLAAGQIMPATSLPKRLSPVKSLVRDSLIERGGSAIIAPDGRYVAGPVFDQETILHACLDLTEIERECMTLDVSGHYSRPDLFRFSVAEEKRE
jgi:nitrilase